MNVLESGHQIKDEILNSLLEFGVAHVPNVLTEEDLNQLELLIDQLEFIEIDEVVKPSGVRQRFRQATIYDNEICAELTNVTESLLTEYLKTELVSPVVFNELTVNKYDEGDGISPHRDGNKYKSVVAIFILSGRGDFYTCHDRNGEGKKIVKAKPGDVILLRGSDFGGKNEQPLHGIENIKEERSVLMMRQVESSDFN